VLQGPVGGENARSQWERRPLPFGVHPPASHNAGTWICPFDTVQLSTPNPAPRHDPLAPLRAAGRALLYLWSFPTTAVGLLFLPFALLARDGGAHVVDGVLELHGGLVTFFLQHCTLLRGGASAMTLGHVVLGRDERLLDLTRSHERVHVRQCERWGPLFIPAYLLASLWVKLRGGRPYEDNPFEREAYGRES
jgi:hypothetical protein